ncbi:MAG: sugar phosphate nucleotidyltransferase [Bacteroidota bacterium]|nr:sugar phosphate nucleotidyltransferase [Bacteroidota bacterium]
MKAMILSAGFGTRLTPYTDILPKALIKYRNIPMINYQIERLKNVGVKELVVNAHHLPDEVIDYFSKNAFGLKINVIVEDEILGTGGGILNAEKFFKDEKFFLVINADIETDFEIGMIITHHKSHNPFATLAVQKRKTTKYLEFDSGMKLIGRQNEYSKESRLFAFNGIHIISNRIFEKDFEIKFEDILNIYFDVIKDKNEIVLGYDTGVSSFKDLGKIESLLS